MAPASPFWRMSAAIVLASHKSTYDHDLPPLFVSNSFPSSPPPSLFFLSFFAIHLTGDILFLVFIWGWFCFLQFIQPFVPVSDTLSTEVSALSTLMGGTQTLADLPTLLDRLMSALGGGKPSTVRKCLVNVNNVEHCM